MRQVIDREDEGFGKAAEVGFMRQGIFLYFFEDFLVGVGRGDLFLDFGRVELPLVLQEVKLLRPGFGVNDADLFALFEKHPLHADVGTDRDNIIINEVAFADRSLIFITEHYVLEVGRGVGGGGSREANLNRVEVVKSLSPDCDFRGGVSSVAFVGDHKVEGMDGDMGSAGKPRSPS